MGRAWAAAWVCCNLAPDLTSLRSQQTVLVRLRSLWGPRGWPGPGARHSCQGGGGQSLGVVSRSSSPCVLDRNIPAGASVFPRYRGDGFRLPEPPKQKGTRPARHTCSGGIRHRRTRCPRGLRVLGCGGPAGPAAAQLRSRPAIPHGLRIAFHPVNPAETALWTHGSPHKGECAQLLGPEGHLTLMNSMNLTAVGGPK